MEPDMSLLIRDARASDLPRMTQILNELIADTTAVWTLSPTTLAARHSWFEERRARGFPVLVAEEDDRMLGFASFGDFRPWEGYAKTVEHSVYVDGPARRRGIGAALLAALIERGQVLGLHAMVGGIEASNGASLALHAALGFREVGRLPEVGRKFDRWLDLVLVERLLVS
jgi:phosphinothricin acetyltransferase